MARYSPIERIGVSAVENIVAKELGWIFREQMIADMGIDAHIELVEDGHPTGKLIAVQIKTGKSHFRDGGDHLIYYGEMTHYEYWVDHSLPVILVAHLPESSLTVWVRVSAETAIPTGKGWKVPIPKDNVFGAARKNALTHVFEGSAHQQKFRKLALDEPLMRHIQDGGKVSLALEDWINKSLGRSPVVVYLIDNEGNEVLSQEYFVFHTRLGIKELAESIFPWASACIDEDFYEANYSIDYGQYYGLGFADEIDHPSFSREIYPYAEACGEVEYFRLQLTLNELGEAYLAVSDYLKESGPGRLWDE